MEQNLNELEALELDDLYDLDLSIQYKDAADLAEDQGLRAGSGCPRGYCNLN